MNPDPRVPAGVFAAHGFDASRFTRSDHKSVRGPCPVCGGTRRMVVWLDRDNPNFECVCGYRGFMDVKGRPSADALAELKAKAAAEAKGREETRRARLAEFSTAELWAELHDRLTETHRLWWAAQGVPADWLDHLRIGFTPDKAYRGADGELHHSPAYTLPYFHTGWQFQTMQYRLDQPEDQADRYRFEQGLGTAYYQTTPGQPIADEVLICEGAKKAIVTRVRGWDGCVLAVPSKGDPAGVAEAVKECGRVWVLLDPDAEAAAVRLGRAIGRQARVVTLPLKVDDGLRLNEISRADILQAMRQGRQVC